MSQDDTNKLIGRLEKGVEVLESGLKETNRKQDEIAEKVIETLQQIRTEFHDELKDLHTHVDNKTTALHTKIDTLSNNNANLRLSVQKLAGTVSLIVGVGIYIVKGVFDVAKDVFANSFFPH